MSTFATRLVATLRDPVQFQRVILKRKLWRQQTEILKAIATNPVVSVKSCHASGKTFLASGLPLWWLGSHTAAEKAIALDLAPTLRQVKLFWNEVALASHNTAFLSFPEVSSVGMRINETSFALGASSSRGVNIQGFHGGKVLIIVDEAPGVGQEIMDAIEGIRAGGDVRMLKLGNPVVPAGHFYEDHTRDRHIIKTFTISAFDTPNFDGVTLEQLLEMTPEQLKANPWDFLITRSWVYERYHKWGPNHPMWYARVLGQFPRQGDFNVYSLDWIERAQRDPEQYPRDGSIIEVGLDVAGAGADETVATARVGGIILDQAFWSDADSRGQCVAWLGQFRDFHCTLPDGTTRRYRLGPVKVDAVGIGYNYALHLGDNGFDVRPVIAGGGAHDPNLYVNFKSEMYWTFREWMERDAIRGLSDEETQAQLASIQYRHTPNGRIEIESKEQAKKRGVKFSPDRAESVILAFAYAPDVDGTIVDDQPVSISPY